MEPDTFRGMFNWVLLGAAAGMAALLVASLWPNIIPARAQGVNL
jgi:hypothetical protein